LLTASGAHTEYGRYARSTPEQYTRCVRTNSSPSEERITTKNCQRQRGRLPAGRKRAKFGARLHHAQNGIARDDANDLRRAVCDTTHDGHLVDIRAQKPLEQAQKGFLW